MSLGVKHTGEIKYFCAITMLILLFSTIPWTNIWIYQKLMPLTLAYGVFLLIRLFFIDRMIYSHTYFWPLFLFGVSYAVTILLNYQKNFFTNVGQLAYTCIYFFVLFCHFSQMEEEKRREVLELLFRIIIWFSLVVAVLSLGMMMMRFSAQVELRDTHITVGFNQRNGGMQLTGVTSGPSSLGNLCLMGIASISCRAFFASRQLYRQEVAGVAVLFLAICGANAYSSLLQMLAFVFVFVLGWHMMGIANLEPSVRIRRMGRGIAGVAVACIVVVGAFYGTQYVETTVVNGMTHLSERIETWLEQRQQPPAPGTSGTEPGTSGTEPGTSGTEPGTSTTEPGTSTTEPGTSPLEPVPPKEEDVPKEDITIFRNLATSATGSRSAIWAEGLRLFLEHPLGVTNTNIEVRVFYGESDYPYYNLHNGYLNLLVSAGIVGFLLVAGFGLMLLWKSVCYLLRSSSHQIGSTLVLLLAVCISILSGDLVNGGFVLWRSGNYFLLWLLLGEICGLTLQQERVKKGKNRA